MTTAWDRDHGKELTARERVLALLCSNVGVWVPAHVITNPEIGGSEGLRRLRELRDRGYRIQQRKHDNGTERDYLLESATPDAVQAPEPPKPKPTKTQILATLDELRALYVNAGTQPSEVVNTTLRWLRSQAE